MSRPATGDRADRDEIAKPSHPHVPAALLMIAVSVFLVLAAALGLG